jgi:hypothetical protein
MNRIALFQNGSDLRLIMSAPHRIESRPVRTMHRKEDTRPNYPFSPIHLASTIRLAATIWFIIIKLGSPLTADWALRIGNG